MDGYFRNIQLLNKALSESGESFRDSRGSQAEAEDRAILWLGCNVLRTPHLAELAERVIRHLLPGVSVLGGPSHCCGSPMPDKNDREAALNRTLRHFREEHAATIISWCPSCHHDLRNGSDAAIWGFEELHITQFIARHLNRLALNSRLSARILLHGHCGTADSDTDMESCRGLLRAIPGVDIAGEHSDCDLGLQCVPGLIAANIGRESCERKLQGIIAQARALGAEMIVTIYHSCYRELEKRIAAGPLMVENYITLLAKAAGISVPANVYREIAHSDTRLVQIAASAAPSEGQELERALRAEFPASRP